MLIVVTVEAEQLPVAAIGWIVVVIVVLVMDRQFPEPPALKRPSAPPAHMRKEAERALAVTLFPQFAGATGLGDDPVLFVVRRWFCHFFIILWETSALSFLFEP